jgi:hypothetical protein
VRELATRSAAPILPLRRKPMGEILEHLQEMAEAGVLGDPVVSN